MGTARALCGSFLHDESGTTAIEYAVIGTMIAVAIFGALGFVGQGVSALFSMASDTAGNSLADANGTFN
jgi:pilus assembly protein Flp/PilA